MDKTSQPAHTPLTWIRRKTLAWIPWASKLNDYTFSTGEHVILGKFANMQASFDFASCAVRSIRALAFLHLMLSSSIPHAPATPGSVRECKSGLSHARMHKINASKVTQSSRMSRRAWTGRAPVDPYLANPDPTSTSKLSQDNPQLLLSDWIIACIPFSVIVPYTPTSPSPPPRTFCQDMQLNLESSRHWMHPWFPSLIGNGPDSSQITGKLLLISHINTIQTVR